jgi:glycosyltransferase involved in cell wall biosynthesis
MVDDSSAPGADAVSAAHQYWDTLLGPKEQGGVVGCFAGSINHQFDLATIACAIAELSQEGIKIKAIIAGDGETRSSLVQAFGPVTGTVWPGWIDRAQLLALLERSDFGLDPMPARADFEATINNKALDYLRAGCGIVSCPERGALARLLREAGCGASYASGDGEALKGILRQLSADGKVAKAWSIAASAFAKSELDPQGVYGRMASSLVDMVESAKAIGGDQGCHAH